MAAHHDLDRFDHCLASIKIGNRAVRQNSHHAADAKRKLTSMPTLSKGTRSRAPASRRTQLSPRCSGGGKAYGTALITSLRRVNDRILNSALARHPQIMLGVLIAILRLNDIAVHSRLACESHIALIVPVGIPSTVLPLSRRTTLTTRRPSMRPLRTAPRVIHSLDPSRQASAELRTCARAVALPLRMG